VEDLKVLRSWREGATLAEKARLGQAQLLQGVSYTVDACISGVREFVLFKPTAAQLCTWQPCGRSAVL